jgi:hypothetical protein
MEEGTVVLSINIQVKEYNDGSFIAYNPNALGLSSYGTTALEAIKSFLEDYKYVLEMNPEELK